MAKVRFTESANHDLVDTEYNIFVECHNPQAAQRIIDGIVNASEKLSFFPLSCPLVRDDALRRVELRMTHFDNYNIFYYYNTRDEVVYIIRILHRKMDWQTLLKTSFF